MKNTLILSKKTEFLGKVFLEEIEGLKSGYRCFAELPRYFLSMMDWIDYEYSVEVLPSYVQGPPEKVIVKDYKNQEPRVFSLFILFDLEGGLNMNGLSDKKVVFTSSQWERFEATLTVDKEVSPWFDYLYSHSSMMRANKRPLVLAKELNTHKKDYDVEIFLYRPSLWNVDWNQERILGFVRDSRAELVILPEYSFGLISKKDFLDAKEAIRAHNRLTSMHSLYKKMLRDFLEEGKWYYGLEYLQRQVEILKREVSSMGTCFEEFKDSMIDLSAEIGRAIATVLVEGKGDKPFSSLVVTFGGDVFVRRLNRGGFESLIFEKGDEPRIVEIGSKKYLFIMDDEVAKYRGNDGEMGELNVVLRSSTECLQVPGRCINMNVYPMEAMVSPIEGLYFSLSLDGSTLAIGSSRQSRYLIAFEGLSLDYLPIK